MNKEEYAIWKKAKSEVLKKEYDEHFKKYCQEQYRKNQKAALELSKQELDIPPEQHKKITISMQEYLTLKAHVYGAYLGIPDDTVDWECDCQV